MEHKDDEMDPISEDEEAAPPPKILVKLKLKTAVPPQEDEEEKRHYCKECNKGFSSGKALGGHMSSAHVQANKDYSVKKLRRHLKYSGTAAEITCNICGKGFRSEKSLFGHMRCHPERCYRGMEPPEENRRELKSWPPGIKRGRGPIGALVRAPEDNNSFASVYEIVRMVGNEGGPWKKPNLVIGESKEKEPESETESSMSVELVRSAAEVLTKMGKGDVLKESKMDDDHSNVQSEKVVIRFDLNLMPEDEEED